MSNPLTPIYNGINYQACHFWCQVYDALSAQQKPIKQIGYEIGTPTFFNDVAVEYETAQPSDYHDFSFKFDLFQIKSHQHWNGALTVASFIDPAFVASKKESALQKLAKAAETCSRDKQSARFTLVTPWHPHPDDKLATLICSDTGCLDLKKLAEGNTCRSEMGKIRKEWCEHLGLRTENELFELLRRFRIKTTSELAFYRDHMRSMLISIGLGTTNGQSWIPAFEALIQQASVRKNWFMKEEIRSICKTAGLSGAAQTSNTVSAHRLGIRSFSKGAEKLQEETKALLCFLDKFDGRWPKEKDFWERDFYPQLSAFLDEHTSQNADEIFALHIEAPLTMAFAAGYHLDSKSGVKAALVQKTAFNKVFWLPDEENLKPDGMESWNVSSKRTQSERGGNDLAVAISATHDVMGDAEAYVEEHLPACGRILHFQLQPRPNRTAVKDGTHAFLLAQQLQELIRDHRTAQERGGRLHLFISAPNSVSYFLGREAKILGSLWLYEYDFDTMGPGAYRPSMSFPPPSTSAGE